MTAFAMTLAYAQPALIGFAAWLNSPHPQSVAVTPDE